jgi:hypothetical protein
LRRGIATLRGRSITATLGCVISTITATLRRWSITATLRRLGIASITAA